MLRKGLIRGRNPIPWMGYEKGGVGVVGWAAGRCS